MKIKTSYIFLLLSFVVLGVYYPTLFAPFNSVDDGRMVNDLLNVEHITLREIFIPGGSGQYYRPLLYLSFVADKFLWGLEESFMHLENILLHMINVWLVFGITCIVQPTTDNNRKGVAFVAALLFALHPLNTEAVNWISGRTDVLAGTFVLFSLFLLLLSLKSDNRFAGFLAAFFYLLGCLAKESAVFLLPGALLIIISRSASDEKVQDLSEKSLESFGAKRFLSLGFLLVPLAYFVFRHFALRQGDRGIGIATAQVMGNTQTLWHNYVTMLKVAGFYVKKLFIPMPLNFGIVTVSNLYIISGIALLFLVVLWLRKRDMVSALFFCAVCIGSSSLVVSVARISWTPVAERYMYMPCAIFAVAIVIAMRRFVNRWSLTVSCSLVSVLLLLFFSWETVERNILWQDNLALAEDTVRKSPNFAPARNDIAIALMKRGRSEEAMKIFNSNKLGEFQAASMNKVLVYIENGEYQQAREFLLKRLENPTLYQDQVINKLIAVDEMIRSKTSNLQEQKECDQEILEQLKKLHRITNDPFCYYRMGRVAMMMGNKVEAGKYFAKAWKTAPKDSYYKAPAGKLATKLMSFSDNEKSE